MKNFKSSAVIIATLFTLFGCSKPEEEKLAACEENNTTKVTFTNTTNTSLRVVVSTRLTPQFEPIDPSITVDLAAGQSVIKEFTAGRYVNSWYNGCPLNCNRRSYNFMDFTQCNEFEEKQ